MPGGGWHLTRADSAGFERWLAYDAHAHGLAVFQKNDPANAKANVKRFDGMIIEECNHYRDPCAGSGGDATPYLRVGKPVLNAEYTQDGETTAQVLRGGPRRGDHRRAVRCRPRPQHLPAVRPRGSCRTLTSTCSSSGTATPT